MFEKSLEAKFKRIFGVKKVTYNEPSESQEQECLFVEIENAMNQVGPEFERSKVTGNAILFGRNEKIPFGFFSKAVHQADPNDTKDIMFTEFEVNTRRYGDIVQRGFSFVYLYKGQYDPDSGTITSVDFIEEQE